MVEQDNKEKKVNHLSKRSVCVSVSLIFFYEHLIPDKMKQVGLNSFYLLSFTVSKEY